MVKTVGGLVAGGEMVHVHLRRCRSFSGDPDGRKLDPSSGRGVGSALQLELRRGVEVSGNACLKEKLMVVSGWEIATNP